MKVLRFAAFVTLATVACAPAWAQAGDPSPSYGYGRAQVQPARAAASLDIRRNARPSAEALAELPLDADEDAAAEVESAPPEPAQAFADQTGAASWYGREFAGRPTATGEIFNPEAPTAAHPSLPLPSLVEVTNLENGRTAVVRVNDRGPFARGRVIDLSHAAAQQLDFVDDGHAQVRIRYLGPAPRALNRTASAEPPPEEGPVSLLPPASDPLGQDDDWRTATPAPLPRYEVQASQPRLPGGYVVQVGAFSDPANAERARTALAEAGDVRVEQISAGGRTLHRVQLVGWPDRAAAETARDRAAALGFPDALVR